MARRTGPTDRSTMSTCGLVTGQLGYGGKVAMEVMVVMMMMIYDRVQI